MRLTAELFDRPHWEETPFGITNGNLHGCCSYTHNAGWYSIRGEFLGWGDLNAEDFQRIAAEIDPQEAFIALFEPDWQNGPYELRKSGGYDYHRPGLDYILKKALYVVRRGQILRVIHEERGSYVRMGRIDDHPPRNLAATPLLERSIRRLIAA